jgi:hypothetical protein
MSGRGKGERDGGGRKILAKECGGKFFPVPSRSGLAKPPGWKILARRGAPPSSAKGQLGRLRDAVVRGGGGRAGERARAQLWPAAVRPRGDRVKYFRNAEAQSSLRAIYNRP